MPTIDILGVSHAYELTLPVAAKPSSPVLVFIHGWLLSRQYWQPLIQFISSEYQCLLYDLRGFGESQTKSVDSVKVGERSNLEFTLAAYAKDLKLLLQELAIDRAWLIGHSLGGSIALWAADCCPELVEGVICLNSGGGIYLKEEFERFRNAGQQLVRYRPIWLSYLPLIDLIFARMMVARPLSSNWGRQRVIDFVRADKQAALGALLDSTTEAEVHFLPQLVSRLKQPVYFVAGAQDKVMELKYVHHLASFHYLFEQDGSNVLEIADCGHLAMVEQPEKVARVIIKILQQYSSV
ncbi:alpha/beta hydrolase [Pleurocapsales cyanobacterium LEGE 06147]|nr:alpha/beta hydrolase [Pleurocapsales cyanobacterium LEGE 06147]